MILCCGEALIDMIPLKQSAGFAPHPGGAIFNTAIALGRLGVASGMFTGLSSDVFGQQLLGALNESHVETSLVVQSDRPCTLAFAHLKDGHATYSFYDENTAGRMLSEDDIPALPESIHALYFGGISLVAEPCGETYAALANAEAERRVIMCDPNIRPSFIKDEPRYRARLEQVLSNCDVVKISDEDLDWIYPNIGSQDDKIAALRALGPAVVIMTRGSEGAVAWRADGSTTQVPSKRVEVVDTVGAGDTFNAGVLASLSEQGLLEKQTLRAISDDQLACALEMGAAVAAVTVSRAGANPPWRAEL